MSQQSVVHGELNEKSMSNLSAPHLSEFEAKAKILADEILKNAILMLNTAYSTSVTIQSISQASNKLSRMQQQIQNNTKEIFLLTMPPNNMNGMENIWPNVSDFEIDDTIARIKCYIGKWHMSERWSVTVNLVQHHSQNGVGEFYRFIATFQLPITDLQSNINVPEATAAAAGVVNAKIWFNFELCSMIDDNMDLPRVTYQFDGMNSIFVADMEMLDFQEVFLKMIIQMKMDLFKRFKQTEHELYSPQ